MKNIEKGNDYQENENTCETFGIDIDGHLNKIEVHNDEKLRDEIVEWLNLRVAQQGAGVGDTASGKKR